jgi:hypothetical protein
VSLLTRPRQHLYQKPALPGDLNTGYNPEEIVSSEAPSFLPILATLYQSSVQVRSCESSCDQIIIIQVTLTCVFICIRYNHDQEYFYPIEII